MVYHDFTAQHFRELGWQQVSNEIKVEMIELASTDPRRVALMMDELLGTQWLIDSFHTTQVLVYNESATPEHVLAIHEYLRNRACNIENIVLFLSGHWGASEWWRQHVSINKIRSFHVLETQIHGTFWDQYQTYGDHPVDRTWLKNKRITKLFGYHGGFNRHPEREFLFLFFQSLGLDARITYINPRFTSWNQLSGWIEHITYYQRQDLVDSLEKQYQQWCQPWKSVDCELPYKISRWGNQRGRFNPFSDCGLFARTYGDTWMAIARESFNRYPFATCTEKIVIPFIYGCVPVGLGPGFDHACQAMSLTVPTGTPDLAHIYSMTDFVDRVDAVGKFLQEMNTVSADDRQDQYNSNIDVYARNIDWVLSGDIHQHLKKQFQIDCDNIAQRLA